MLETISGNIMMIQCNIQGQEVKFISKNMYLVKTDQGACYHENNDNYKLEML